MIGNRLWYALLLIGILVIVLIQQQVGNSILFITAITLIFIVLLKNHKVILPLTILVNLFDFTIGGIGSTPNILIREIFIPVAFLVFIIKKLLSKNIRLKNPIFLFLFLLSTVITGFYVTNPILPGNILGLPDDADGFRAYYTFFINVMSLLLIAGLFSYTNIRNAVKIVAVFLMLILVIAFIELTSGNPILIPLLPNDQIYWIGLYQMDFTRIGFMQIFGPLIALYYLSRLFEDTMVHFYMTLGILFGLIITFISGSRSAFASLLIVIIIYLLFIKRSIPLVIVFLIIFLMLGYLSSIIYPDQLTRIGSIGIGQLDDGRKIAYEIYIKSFLSSPVFGMGVGVKKQLQNILPLRESLYYFLTDQLISGGHGSYISIIFTFGLSGAIPWYGLLISTLTVGYMNIKRTIFIPLLNSWSIFSFLFFVFIMGIMTVGGNGLNIQLYYCSIGLIAGIYNKVNIQEGINER